MYPQVSMSSGKPTRKGGEVRFTGTEYAGSFSTSATLTVDNVLAINPRVTGLFPRLSSVAPLFGKWALNKLRFQIIGAAASTQSGAMTTLIEYDPIINTYTSAQARSSFGQVTTKFWENSVQVADPSKQTTPWMFTDNVNGSDVDTLETFGAFHLVTEPTAAGVIVAADVFVDYDIEFCAATVSGLSPAPVEGVCSIVNGELKTGSSKPAPDVLRLPDSIAKSATIKGRFV
jgi:hypothetical protein